uniref:Uncharacterized protein n=2 Tax=Parascaris univalens TaxID=6257 RepID=A0A915CKQ8_PARUN
MLKLFSAKYEQKPAKTNDSHLRRKVSADEHLNERQREKIDNSKGHMQESGNESSSEKSYTSSDRTRNAAKKVTKDEKSSKFEKIFLLELEPELNQVDVRQNFEPLMKPVPFVPPLTVSDGGHHQDAHKVDHNDFSSAHPPQIHVDFGERRPTDDDRESERYSTKDEEQKQEPEKVLKPSKEGKREENVGGVEFEKQKPIQTIVEMFGGSVAHDRIDALSDDGNEGDSKGGQSLMSKRGVPAVAVKYVEAVNAAPVIKNRTSAYDELYFYDESLGKFH